MNAAVDIPPPSINGTLPDGSTTANYSASVDIVGGVASFDISLASGSLPPGVTMSLNGSTINFAGQPTTTGNYNFSVTVVVRPKRQLLQLARLCTGSAFEKLSQISQWCLRASMPPSPTLPCSAVPFHLFCRIRAPTPPSAARASPRSSSPSPSLTPVQRLRPRCVTPRIPPLPGQQCCVAIRAIKRRDSGFDFLCSLALSLASPFPCRSR